MISPTPLTSSLIAVASAKLSSLADFAYTLNTTGKNYQFVATKSISLGVLASIVLNGSITTQTKRTALNQKVAYQSKLNNATPLV